MSKKSEVVQKLLKKIAPRTTLPKPLKDASLLEQGLLVVLVRHMSQDKAETTLARLKKAFQDWNELRVAQAQEIASRVVDGTARAPRESIAHLIDAVEDTRAYLQEVFQKVHGFDLEPYREDQAGAQKLFTQMPFLGLSGGSFLLWLCGGQQLPVHQPLVRVLERLGLIGRSASPKKWREAVEPLVPDGDDLNFVSAFNEVAERWCLPRNPICWECPLVDDCPVGRKVLAEWKVSQVKLEAQRARDDAKKAELDKKEAARRAKEDERERKKHEAEEQKLARERDRLAKIEAKRREEEQREKKKLDLQAKKVAAEAARAAAEAKKAAKPAVKPAPKPAAKAKVAAKPKAKAKVAKKPKPAAKPAKAKAKAGKKR